MFNRHNYAFPTGVSRYPPFDLPPPMSCRASRPTASGALMRALMALGTTLMTRPMPLCTHWVSHTSLIIARVSEVIPSRGVRAYCLSLGRSISTFPTRVTARWILLQNILRLREPYRGYRLHQIPAVSFAISSPVFEMTFERNIVIRFYNASDDLWSRFSSFLRIFTVLR